VELEGELIDNTPSGSPEIYKGTEAKVSPSTLLDNTRKKKASDRKKPIFFIITN
tara:strand:- start:331 stop:492 length:162 start_codon:yes stop_codon:yes gene_type:complete